MLFNTRTHTHRLHQLLVDGGVSGERSHQIGARCQRDERDEGGAKAGTDHRAAVDLEE